MTSQPCNCCDEVATGSTGFVLRADSAYAAYFVAWYPHQNEAWLDVILGSWEEPEYPRHVTFGCRIGAVDGQAAPACSLVDAATTRADQPMFGRKLTPDEARQHESLPEFWEVTDWLMLNDPVLHEHVFHFEPDATG